MSGIDVLANIKLSPEQVASAFWKLDSVEQADFFAALERMAGYRLCLQMAAVVHELTERSERGEFDALIGYRTMFDHAEDYPEAAASWRAARAKSDIRRMAEAAKGSQP